jgi:signal transduction histidine kinase
MVPSMRLRKKTVIIITALAVSTMLLTYILSQSLLLGTFAELERQDVFNNIQRASNAVNNEIADLNSKCGDWAEWDDSYNFMKDNNSNYAEANINVASFINLRINLLMFVNTTGQLTASEGFDLQNLTETAPPQSFNNLIGANGVLWNHTSTLSRINGLTVLPEGPLLFASRPILTSEQQGPIEGALIMARFLNSQELSHIGNTTQLPISATVWKDAQESSELKAVTNTLTPQNPMLSKPLTGAIVAGYYLMEDVFGNPGVVLKIEMPRDIYAAGLSTTEYFTFATISVSIFFGAITILLLEKTVLYRLVKLTTDVNKIGTSGRLSRLKTQGDDELSTLGVAINKMLTEIDDKSNKLQKTERLAAIGEIAAMVGHDLRNPLTGIANCSFYLRRKMNPATDAKTKEMFSLIDQDVKYSNKIINDLLDYSREFHLERQKTSYSDILRMALSVVKIPENIHVTDTANEEYFLNVDGSQMKRALINLVSNAIESMPQGGEITFSAQETAEAMKIAVSDTGTGMTPEVLRKIWSPLFTTKAKGMGFGLCICKRIVEAHGGTITVQSELGKGTTITLTFPKEKNLQEVK